MSLKKRFSPKTGSPAGRGRARELARRVLGWRVARFALVGGAASLSYAILGLLFVQALAAPPVAGNALAYALSFIVSYAGQAMWTFRAGASHGRSLPRFAVAQSIGLAVNTAVVWLGLGLGLPYPLAMLAALLGAPAAVYALCRSWVFREAGEEGGS